MTFLDELVAAGRGTIALIIGDRGAARYFDFSQRGLAGSFIALLSVTALGAVLPAALGTQDSHIGQSVISAAILFVSQLGFSALALAQIRRLDGLAPYLVADNWCSFFVSLFSNGLAVIGLSDQSALFLIAVLVLVVAINIGRLVLKLAPPQIGMFIIAQIAGVACGLTIIHLAFPVPADAALLAAQ